MYLMVLILQDLIRDFVKKYLEKINYGTSELLFPKLEFCAIIP